MSPSHEIKVDFLDSNCHNATIELLETEIDQFFNKDFIMLYRNDQINKPIVLLQKKNNEYALMVSMLADVRATTEDTVVNEETKLEADSIIKYPKEFHGKLEPAEFIFILDRSLSMRGRSIEKAKHGAILGLKSLPQNSLFNVVSFGTEHEQIFEESYLNSEENINEAIRKIEDFKADLENSETQKVLQHVFSQNGENKELSKHVIMVTDLRLWLDREETIELIKRNSSSFTFHIVGVGEIANKYFAAECSNAGNGKYFLARDFMNDIETGINHILLSCVNGGVGVRRKNTSINGDFKIESLGEKDSGRYIYNGEHLTSFSIIDSIEGELEGSITYEVSTTSGETTEYIIDLQKDSTFINGDSIFKMFAASKIKELESIEYFSRQDIIDTSKEYQKPTRYTSQIEIRKPIASPDSDYTEITDFFVKVFDMEITVITLTGKRFNVYLQSSDTLETLKTTIEIIGGIPKEKQRLVFAGQLLQGQDTLDSFGIKDGDKVHMVLNPRGGSEAPSDPNADDEGLVLPTLPDYLSLVMLQKSDGSFDSSILPLLGISSDNIATNVPEVLASKSEPVHLTYLVLNELLAKHQETKSRWTLSFIKAIRYIEHQ
uniref:Ubiquitin-like domain-containing protein n=1 Tax=Euplotes crassus TaxID=5936 RepID=A0A7S3NSF0_EUPCR